MEYEIESILNDLFGKTGRRRQDAGAVVEFAIQKERYRCRKIAEHYEEVSTSEVAKEIRGHIENDSRVIS